MHIKTSNQIYKTYFILLFFSLAICLILPISWGDDSIFQEKSGNLSLISFIDGSARPFTDSFTYIFSKFKILWRILNPVIMVSLLAGVSYLLPFKLKAKETVVLFICLMFPTMIIVDAGFIATTVNYLWAITFGIISIIPLKQALKNERIKWYMVLLTYPLILYATNMQQMAVVLVVIFFSGNLYLLINKKFNLFLLFQFIVAAGGLVWSFCLNMFGENNRMIRETARYFPLFGELNLLEKIELGFSSTFYSLTMNPHFAVVGFLAFTVFLSIMVLKRKNNWMKIIVSLIPPVFTVIMCILKLIPGSTVYSIITGGMQYYRMEKAIYSFKPVTDLIFIFLICCILYSLYCAFSKKRDFCISFFVLCIGLGTRIIMGFSPTVWASGHRTFCVMFITFVIVGFLVYNDYKALLKNNEKV